MKKTKKTTKKRVLRRLNREEVEEILTSHKKWIETNGKEGEQADLSYVNFTYCNPKGWEDTEKYGKQHFDFSGSKFIFTKVNFSGSVFRNERFNEADLKQAVFKDAKFFLCNLMRAKLNGMKFMEMTFNKCSFIDANLEGVNFIGCDLSDSKIWRESDSFDVSLKDASFQDSVLKDIDFIGPNQETIQPMEGISSEQFAGTDLTGAKLPEPIAKFEGLEYIEKTARISSKLLTVIILFCFYTGLTILTTTDFSLIVNRAASALPIFGINIQIGGFYWVAPFCLMLLYLYFNLYLLRLWEELADMPAIFPDGKPLYRRTYPWIIISRIRRHSKLLKEKKPSWGYVQDLITGFMIWWIVPFTLIAIWLRYLNVHDSKLTIVHSIVIAFSLFFAWLFGRHSVNILLHRIKKSTRSTYPKYFGIIAVILLLLIVFSSNAINGNLGKNNFRANLNNAEFSGVDLSGKDLRRADFSGANIDSPCLFEKTDIRGADFGTATIDNRSKIERAVWDSLTIKPYLIYVDFKLPCPNQRKYSVWDKILNSLNL